MDKDQQKQFILHDDITKIMWRLSLPAIGAMMLFGLNAFMDTVYIGQLMDPIALAGISIAYPLTGMMMAFGALAGTGAANLLSIALGSNDEATQQKVLPNATLMMLISSIIFSVPAYIFAEPLIVMMGGSGQVLEYGVEYFQITMFSAPFWMYALGLNLIIRGEGKMKVAALMMSYGLIVNLVLTPIFIYHFKMGVGGAAWATNIGMLIYSFTGYWYFKSGQASFKGNINSLAYDAKVFKDILKMGFPGFIMSIMGLVQAVVVFNAIAQTGTDEDLAFFAAANRIIFFLMTPLFGLMRALQPVLGINFGALAFDRVKESLIVFTKTGTYMMAPFWFMITFFPEFSLRLVLPDMAFTDQDIFNLRVFMAVLPLLPFVFMALTFFPAINQAKHASIIGLARQIIFYVPVMLILPHFYGLNWVYYGSTLIDIIITLWMLLIVIKLLKRLNPPEFENEQKPLALEVDK